MSLAQALSFKIMLTLRFYSFTQKCLLIVYSIPGTMLGIGKERKQKANETHSQTTQRHTKAIHHYAAF